MGNELIKHKILLYRPLAAGHLTRSSELIAQATMGREAVQRIAALFREMAQAVYPEEIAGALILVIKAIYAAVGSAAPAEDLCVVLQYMVIKHAPPDIADLLDALKAHPLRDEDLPCPREELEYYVCTTEVVLGAIERLEYESLHITREEYDIIVGTYSQRASPAIKRWAQAGAALLKRNFNFFTDGR